MMGSQSLGGCFLKFSVARKISRAPRRWPLFFCVFLHKKRTSVCFFPNGWEDVFISIPEKTMKIKWYFFVMGWRLSMNQP